jgi:hypothetical protein
VHPHPLAHAHIDQRVGLVDVATPALDQGPSNIDRLLDAYPQTLGEITATPGVDINSAIGQHKDVGDPGIIHDGGERTERHPEFW